MNSFCLILLIFALGDSTEVSINDTIIENKSILFKSEIIEIDKQNFKYHFQQGFFCDFEDRLNENRKLKLNIGVGHQ